MTRRSDQEGLIASQLAVLMPALLLLIMLSVQFGLWAHATQLANAAADTAATAASLPDATEADGRTAAAGLLAQAGHLADITITVERTVSLVAVQVTGTAPQVVPGFRWAVAANAVAPVERFIPEGERP